MICTPKFLTNFNLSLIMDFNYNIEINPSLKL